MTPGQVAGSLSIKWFQQLFYFRARKNLQMHQSTNFIVLQAHTIRNFLPQFLYMSFPLAMWHNIISLAAYIVAICTVVWPGV